MGTNEVVLVVDKMIYFKIECGEKTLETLPLLWKSFGTADEQSFRSSFRAACCLPQTKDKHSIHFFVMQKKLSGMLIDFTQLCRQNGSYRRCTQVS